MPNALRVFALVATAILALNVIAAESLDRPVVKGPLGTQADEFLSRAERLGFSGAIILAKDGEVVLHKAYGFRNPEEKAPYTIDTVAPIGSITKQFTAAAILALEEEGKLRVEDPMAKYLPDVPDDKKAITLHELLTHSAGFPGAIGDDEEAINRDDFVKRAFSRKLLFQPGTAYEYSNVGFSLLAAIIEKVTGATYERYLHDRLFVRAGMEQTGYVIPKWDHAKLARGVRDGELMPPFEGEGHWAADGPYWNLRGNGGIMSTPADMYRWHLALLGDKVLSAASRKKLFTPYVREGAAPSSYAYGWAVFPLPNGHTLIAHNGGNTIYAADFRRYVDDGITYFICSNISDKSSIAVSRWIGRMATGMEVAMPPKVVALPKTDLDALAGTYSESDGASITVSATARGLAFRPANGAGFEVLSSDIEVPKERVADIARRSQEIADGIVKSDFKPLQAAFDEPRPLEVIESRQRAMRERLEGKHGPLHDAQLIGVRQNRDMLQAVVRLGFERGNEYLILIWSPRPAVEGLLITEELTPTEVLPTSKNDFVAYDFRTNGATAFRFADGRLEIGGRKLSRVADRVQPAVK